MKKTPNIIQMMKTTVLATFGLALTASLHAQDVLVDLELSLAVDVSGSVDASEYALQMGGYANAFENPRIHAAISSGALSQIAVNLIQYGTFASESVTWTLITDATSSISFADAIRNAARIGSGLTSISAGIDLAVASIASNGFDGTRKVIDVSGDGPNNSGRSSADARDAALAAGIDSINGLPILTDVPDLDQYYEDNVQGGTNSFTIAAATFEDFENAVLAKLEAEILGQIPGARDPEAQFVVSSTLRTASIITTRTMTRDVGGRLSRMRAGVEPAPVQRTQPATAPAHTAKGGMAKGAVAPAVTLTHTPLWQIWGQLFYSDESQDALYQQTGLTSVPTRMLRADTDIEVFGGTVGIERRLNHGLTAGLAFSLADTDVKMRNVGNTDIETWALIPYISYYRSNAFQGADFYADLLYAYSDNDYDTDRITGARGSTSGDSHMIEVNAGLNFRSGNIIHGPYGQFRWLDGDIDGYTETGPGALTYDAADYKSVATQLGYQVSFPMQVQGGTLIPQFHAGWEHEFEADQGSIGGIPLGEVDEDLAVLGAGLGYYMANGFNMAVNYEARLGSDTENHYIGLRLGMQF